MRFTITCAATFLAAMLSGCGTVPSPPPPVNDIAHVTEALGALRAGGYVMVVRHGATNEDEADVNPLNLDDCSSQRTLSDIGRLMASGVGKLLAREAVPVTVVRSSRYCRAIETAQRYAETLKVGQVSTTDDFSEGGQVVSPKENERRSAAMRATASSVPAGGGNALIVSHRTNIMEAFGASLFNITEGEMVVFKPAAAEPGYKLMWRIKVADFSAYTRTQRTAARIVVSGSK